MQQHNIICKTLDPEKNSYSNNNKDAPPSEQLLLDLYQKLQTSLDIVTLLKIFSKTIQTIVPHESIRYQAKSEAKIQQIGAEGAEKLRYSLVIGSQTLGTLELTRRHAFAFDESETLESCLMVLIYPLKHATAHAQAMSAALTDTLTGCGNRCALMQSLDRSIDFAHRHHSSLSILLLDVDNFKAINDTYGHPVGDHILKLMIQRIQETIRYHDQIYRYGGDEFVITLANTPESNAQQLAERIRNVIANTNIQSNNTLIQVTVTVGIASLRATETTHDLFCRADHALYTAKQRGKNQVCCL